MNFFKHSIIARLGVAMFAISLMALISMISSVIVAESTQGDAAGINLAGSLRMMSYRIVAQTQQYEASGNLQVQQRAAESIAEFDKRIRSRVLANVIPDRGDHELQKHYQAIIDEWQHSLAPALREVVKSGHGSGDYPQRVDQFVPKIDAMVQLLERSTESKIKLLSLVQGISLFMTVLIIFIAMYDIKCNVVEPLAQLLMAAKEASQGKLDARVYYQSEDELGVLGATFNHMAEELSKIYTDLENRVQRKTAELRSTNQSLQLLYDTTRRFNRDDEDICRRLIPVMKQLEELTPIGPVNVTLRDPNQRRSYRQLNTQLLERPANCTDHSCNDCLIDKLDQRPHETLSLPIQTREAYFGEFNADFLADQPPSREQIKLMKTIVENLGVVLSLELKAEQAQQMSLMEERAVIARELHDSLAQSLSYLKMQVSRLQLLRKKQVSEEQIDGVVDELKDGLNNAYRQLRELLTTFRLSLDQPGLEPALQTTVKEFSERLGLPVALHYGIRHQTLSPNEEIHVLQLVREALANVVKHSQASEVSVQLKQNGGQIEVRIEDNGVGLPDDKDLTNHYGLVIMRDRAHTLGGDLSVQNRAEGGVCVLMTFSAKQQ
ncbi:type IV pili methyl-accepting chemotaxis transducer N-terminal domain-containing protein [Marinobacterium arenosum]|uniref:type IV pili methyl-accepting chemotaxis transducer N-terminal domain-containing protein n=1 Tax=Marinobacterium arenosum TaxID=2862496 RepID=UPI001C941A93|nr:type IV pili methyl-accepting chemotaxis transducer N-terminal domain-containing protein [Marinobacterium arenosum]MBY4676369.1 type IV pili methyl-accepting chemotaxis transducer N-terminal domain-containing protein [Marinobacterium arenosum]